MEPQEQGEAPEQGPAEDPKAQLMEALDGLMSATEAMKTVGEAFMQMGQKGPAQKLMQAGDMAAGAIQEMLGGGGGQKPAMAGMQDPNAAGNPNAVPVG